MDTQNTNVDQIENDIETEDKVLAQGSNVKKVATFLVLMFALLNGALLYYFRGQDRYHTELTREPAMYKYRPLPEYVKDHMNLCGAKLSPGLKEVRAKQVARIAEENFSNRDEQEGLVVAIRIESCFSNGVTSPTGARGLGQIIPSYANDFSKMAKIGVVDKEELYDSELSLTLSAALFKNLLSKHNSNIGLALSAYNQGGNSPTFKAALRGSVNGMAPEGRDYLAKFLLATEQAKDKSVVEVEQ